MKFREMRFAKIEGLEVIVEVQSAAEAKAAIKELRHKKKEFSLLKRRMLKEQRVARRTAERAQAARERLSQKKGMIAAFRRVSRVFRNTAPQADLEAIERELDHTDEILHNIDSCIIQIEGKLLTFG
jgi:hypothetical protein